MCFAPPIHQFSLAYDVQSRAIHRQHAWGTLQWEKVVPGVMGRPCLVVLHSHQNVGEGIRYDLPWERGSNVVVIFLVLEQNLSRHSSERHLVHEAVENSLSAQLAWLESSVNQFHMGLQRYASALTQVECQHRIAM